MISMMKFSLSHTQETGSKKENSHKLKIPFRQVNESLIQKI